MQAVEGCNMEFKLKAGLVSGFIAYVIGSINFVTLAFFICILLDFITGLLSSKEFDREKATQGIKKKIGLLIYWMVFILIELVFVTEGQKVGITMAKPYIVLLGTFYLLGTEIASINKNLKKLGVCPPKWINGIISKFKGGEQ
jgi:phage-related holin